VTVAVGVNMNSPVFSPSISLLQLTQSILYSFTSSKYDISNCL